MYLGMVYISWGNVYRIDLLFFSGHSFNVIAFLSPINADGAVKFLLF